ncbi:MAG: tetratricopeptide repeat protein [Dehalococcoidia bacterium]
MRNLQEENRRIPTVQSWQSDRRENARSGIVRLGELPHSCIGTSVNELALFLGQAFAAEVATRGVDAFRARLRGGPLQEAATRTGQRFPQYSGLAEDLRDWALAHDFAQIADQVQQGITPDHRNTAGFEEMLGMASGYTTSQEDAAQVLQTFFKEVARGIYNGPDGHTAIVAHADQRFRELSGRLDDAAFGSIESLSHTLRGLGILTNADAQSLLSIGKLDIIDSLIDDGRVRTAGRLFDSLVEQRIEDSDDRSVQSRIRSLRGRLALSERDHSNAMVHFEAAYALAPDRLTRLRLAVVASETEEDIPLAHSIWGDIHDSAELNERELANVIALLRNLGDLPALKERVAKHPHLALKPLVAMAYAGALAMEGEFGAAESHLRRTLSSLDKPHPRLQLLLGQVLAEAAGHAIDADRISEAVAAARSASQAFSDVEDSASTWEESPVRLAYWTAYARVEGIVGRWDQSVRRCDAALREDPSSPEVILFKARALSALEQFDEALAAIETFTSDNPAASRAAMQIRGEALLRSGEVREAASCLLQALDWDQPDAQVYDFLARALDGFDQEAAEALLQAVAAVEPPNYPARIAYTKRLIRCGRLSEADIALDDLVAAAQSGTQLDAYDLGALLYTAKRYDSVAKLLRPLVGDSPEHPAAGLLLRALMSCDAIDEADQLATRMLNLESNVDEAAGVLAALAESKGDAENALRYTDILSRLRPNDARIRHAQVADLLRLGRDGDAQALLRALRSAELEGSPQDLLELAHLALVLGDRSAALLLAYRARRLGDSSPEVHLQYTGLLLRLLPEDQAPNEIASGAGIELRSESGRTIDLRILDWGEQPLDELEIAPTTTLARVLIGRHIGDDLEDPSSLLPGRWQITGIMSKYGYMARTTFRTFIKRFGTDAGMSMIPFDGNDPSAILEQLDARQQYASEVLRDFENWRMPLVTLARRLGVSRSHLWLSAEEGHGNGIAIRFQNGDPVLDSEELKKWSGSLVLDLAAVRTLSILGLTALVLETYPGTVIPQAHIDCLLEEVFDARTAEAEPGSMGANGAGGYFMDEPSVERLEKRRLIIEGALATARQLPVKALPITDPATTILKDQVGTRMLGADNLAALRLTAGTGAWLVSDDAFITALARQYFGLKASSTQSLLLAMRERGVLNENQYRDALSRLVASGYQVVSVSVADLIWLVSCGERSIWAGAFAQLRSGSCEYQTAVRFAATALCHAALYSNLSDHLDSILADAGFWLMQGRDQSVLEDVEDEIRGGKWLYVGDRVALAGRFRLNTANLRGEPNPSGDQQAVRLQGLPQEPIREPVADGG